MRLRPGGFLIDHGSNKLAKRRKVSYYPAANFIKTPECISSKPSLPIGSFPPLARPTHFLLRPGNGQVWLFSHCQFGLQMQCNRSEPSRFFPWPSWHIMECVMPYSWWHWHDSGSGARLYSGRRCTFGIGGCSCCDHQMTDAVRAAKAISLGYYGSPSLST